MKIAACVLTAAGIWFLPPGAAHPLHAANPQPLVAIAPGPTPSSAPHRALLDRYCVTCHNDRLRTADLALDTLDLEHVGQAPEVWEKVVRKLRAGVMPPAGRPRPDQPAYDGLATWLETALDHAAAASPDPGRTEPFHRLNRAEYRNAVRDLLALDIDITARLPPDDASYGFDNIAGVLKMSPTLMDRYLSEGSTRGSSGALEFLLISPDFLFRVERDPEAVPPKTAYRVSDLELATRLSFFLWSSIPDAELLDLAVQGELRRRAELERQVRRMLADPRSSALVSNFAAQWLFLRNLPALTPDPRLFPDFDEGLREAMRLETELFVESIIREDRNVTEFLTADYTFVNERLARHYGIPHVQGSHFRRITVPGGTRGGLLGQASILTVTAYPHRTSPVLRGKWVLENILGTPPPPPPPDVPPLEETPGAAQALSMRERMVQHRSSPTCAACHAIMDPPGLSLEQFDAVGRWREVDASFAPIDATGGLPDGTTFDGVAGLRQALLSRPEQFISTLSEKMLTYALGRGVEYYDAPALRAIFEDAAPDDYRFSSLVLGIVNSTPFQMRRTQP